MSFRNLIRIWREHRGLSQIGLAHRAGLSARHVSFVETGRASPSRKTVDSIADALELPDIERRRLLIYADFAEDWDRISADENVAESELSRLEPMLCALDPLPACVVSPSMKASLCNRGASAFFRHCDRLDGGDGTNAFDILLLVSRPDRFRSLVTNWPGLAEKIRGGLDRLSPDPERIQHTALLYDAIREEVGRSITPSMDVSSCKDRWSEDVEICDSGCQFALNLSAYSFTGGWAGYTQLACFPVPGSDQLARDYFSQLIELFD